MTEPQCPHGCGRPEHLLPAIGNSAVGLHDCPGIATVDPKVSARRARIKELDQQGVQVAAIASAVNTTRQTVHRDLAALGLRGSRDIEKILDRRREVDHLTRQGLSATEIANRVGCCQRQVQRDRATNRGAA